MSQVNMDELVASLKHSHIGNEARDLSTLHAQLSKALLQFPHFPQTPIPSSPVTSHAPLGGFAPPTTPTHGRTQYFDQMSQGGHYQYAPPSFPRDAVAFSVPISAGRVLCGCRPILCASTSPTSPIKFMASGYDRATKIVS
ncbi:hypothetical protein OPQ81_004397 [Rhizoctonia solani]|nr:hypothetical protein OPQ81_004397 [Rhizoctonia solani]